MKRAIVISSFVISILIFQSSQVMAQWSYGYDRTLKTIPASGLSWDRSSEAGKIHLGDMKVIPGLTVRGLYDDNIYLGSGSPGDEEESDWVFHIMPSLLLDYAFAERGGVKLGFQADVTEYVDNTGNDWQTYQGLLDVDYRAPGGLIVGVRNVYENTENPYSSANDYELGQKIKRWDNDLNSKIGFGFSERFKALTYYNYYKIDYDRLQDFTQNFDSNEIGLGFEMRVYPKTWGFVRYHHGKRDFFSHGTIFCNESEVEVDSKNDTDYTWDRVNTGLTWDAGAKVSGELNFGYQWKDYDNPFDACGNPYYDRDTWIASTFISYDPTATTTLSLSMLRALRDVGSGSDEYYVDTGGGLGVQHVVLEKITLSAGGIYSKNDYSVYYETDEHRKDDNYKANVGFDYRIQDWISTGFAYNYWKKNSNVNEYDFADNQFMATIDIVY